jgi:hypothetical protein
VSQGDRALIYTQKQKQLVVLEAVFEAGSQPVDGDEVQKAQPDGEEQTRC